MPLELAYRYFGGEGRTPLVILHGLLGSSRNWTTVGKILARSFEVFALDLRGHGESPWAPAPERDYSFAAFAGDVAAWLDARKIHRPVLLGHSLGGKVAMRLGAGDPARFRGLVAADIAPRDYPLHHETAFEAMLALDLAKLSTRAEAEKILLAQVHDTDMARFVLTNLVREADAGFRWRVDVEGLRAALPEISKSSLAPGETFPGPTLFLRGDRSDYVREADRPAIAAHFPRHQLMQLGRAGHNLHVDQPASFVSAMEYFALELD